MLWRCITYYRRGELKLSIPRKKIQMNTQKTHPWYFIY